MTYHEQAPEKAERAEGEIFIIDFAENEACNRKQEDSKKANQHKRHHSRHNIEEKLEISAVCFAVHHLKAIRKGLLHKEIGVLYLDDVLRMFVSVRKLKRCLINDIGSVTGRIRQMNFVRHKKRIIILKNFLVEHRIIRIIACLHIQII